MVPASAVVLAGGASRRLGQDKRTIRFDPTRTLLQQTIDRLATLTDDVVVVGASVPSSVGPIAARIVTDEPTGNGPLGGLVAGFRSAHYERAVVVACDLPFLSVAALRRMLDYPFDYDLLVPRRADGTLEMLHAIYRTTCSGIAAQLIAAKRLKVAGLAGALEGEQRRVRYLDEDFFRDVDPELTTFLNVNTPADLADARVQAGLRYGSC
jgi:molybdopterin-guanine dinucleotide biosynthesis protein A